MPPNPKGFFLVGCPKCGAGYKVRQDVAGHPITCRRCRHQWTPTEAGGRTTAGAEAALPKPKQDAGGPTPAPEKQAAPPREEEKTDPLVGTVLNGFKILSRLGSGGFGVVYRAFDTNLERSIAIKMLPADIAKAGGKLLDRFLREARSAAKLSHPNIVTIHQICQYQNTFYIVMELVDGGALHEFLSVQGVFKPSEATRIIRAAAEGLGHAHQRGVIHRDIKPSNVMMTNDGQVKVSDFGLARDVLQRHDIVGEGHSLGTPRYMAPEQALGEEPTAASDLYSLAATYYVLLTGRPPFDAPTDRQLMKKQVTEPVPDPRRYAPTLPATVYRFFEKAMAKPPEDRYQTAEEFITTLDRIDFSDQEDMVPTPQALSAGIGPIAAEDRGSHLSRVLGRAVRRAQRQRTPAPRPFMSPESRDAAASFLSGWKLWLLIGFGIALLTVAAIIVAYSLAPEPPEPPASPGEPSEPDTFTPRGGAGEPPIEVEPERLPAEPHQPATAGEPPTEVEPEQLPAEPQPEQPPEQPEQPPIPANTVESNAQEQLKAAREFEADPDAWSPDVVRAYQDVIDIYPGTQAAEEARKALARLRGNANDAEAEPSAEKSETPPEGPEAE